VNDGVTDRIVSRYCRGLKFTKVAPGGHRDLSFTMVLPRNLFPGLGPDDRAYVYDVRTGRTIFDAYLENPTPTDGPGGQQYDVQAMGGMALANDETRALIYIDRRPQQLRTKVAPSTPATSAPAPSAPASSIQYPSGNTVPNAVYIGATTLLFTYAVMNIGGSGSRTTPARSTPTTPELQHRRHLRRHRRHDPTDDDLARGRHQVGRHRLRRLRR
jgi:hypothetical protein